MLFKGGVRVEREEAAMADTQRDAPPAHPGTVLREEYLEPLGLTQRALADALQVPYQRINELVRGKRGVTPSTALRLARYLGAPAEWWLELQARWDLYYAQESEAEELAAIDRHTGSPDEALRYAPPRDPGDVVREARGGTAMGTTIQLPPDLLALLDRRGRAHKQGLAEQVIEMVRAFLQGEVDPILQPGDPLLSAPVAEGSGRGDLAAGHDRYLYARQEPD
jgi:addiction module HigA family antidote